MTSNATAAPARTAARRYSEQLHTLVDVDTRAYTLGLAELAARRGGYLRPKEGEEVRDLLDEAIARRYKADPDAYRQALIAGRKLLAERQQQAGDRAAQTTRMVAAVAPPRE